jgi:hypothetical protein
MMAMPDVAAVLGLGDTIGPAKVIVVVDSARAADPDREYRGLRARESRAAHSGALRYEGQRVAAAAAYPARC